MIAGRINGKTELAVAATKEHYWCCCVKGRRWYGVRKAHIPIDVDAADYDDWLPLLLAAELADKSRWTLYTLAREGRIESSRAGKRVMVKWGSLCDYFEQRK